MISLVFALAILFAAYFVVPYTVSISGNLYTLFHYVPHFLMLIGLLLSVQFNRSRAFFILLVMLVFVVGTDYFFEFEFKTLAKNPAYLLMLIMVPVNLIVFSLLKERGILTVHGTVKLFFILFQCLMMIWLVKTYPAEVVSRLSEDIFKFKLPANILMPQIVCVTYLIFMMVMLIVFFKKRTALDAMLFGCLLAIIVILNNIVQHELVTIYLAVIALLIIVGVLQGSYNMAFLDELTGLPGRRALNDKLSGLGLRYVIAMLDIDHFKKFNDTYGHDVGDQVLQMVAIKMSQITGGGKVYRYGGEEFTVVFPGKKMDDVIVHLEALRDTIAHYELVIRGKDRPVKKPKTKQKKENESVTVSVTVSLGVAERNDHARTMEEVMKSADDALYRAKKKGRNCLSQ